MENPPFIKEPRQSNTVQSLNPPIFMTDMTETNSSIHTQAQTNQASLVIDSTSSKFTISLFASFIIVIISTFIICGFLPNAYSVVRKSQSKCDNPTTILANYSIQCSEFDIETNPKRGMLVRGLSEDNQYVITNTNFYLIEPEKETILKGDVRFQQYAANEEQDSDDTIQDGIQSVQAPYQVDYISKYNKIYNDQAMLLGLQHQLFYQHTIVSPNQLFIADFVNLSAQPNLKNVTMEIIFINSSFTKFSIGVRLIFFVISLIACVYYIIGYKRLDRKIKVLEHKLILVMSVLLVLFNNPLIILVFKGQQHFLIFFTQLTSILLPVFVLFFWFCAFERGDIENTLHTSAVLRKPFKWILFIILLAFELAIYIYKASHHLLDYVGNPYPDPKPLVVLDYISFSTAVICLLFMLIRAVNIFRNAETMSRYRVLVVLSVFFIVYMAIFLFSQSFYVFSIKPKSIFMVMVFMNLYVYYLQFLYQPIEHSLVQPVSIHDIVSVPTSHGLDPVPYSPYNKQNAPKLSTIIERSVEQSLGKFSYVGNQIVNSELKTQGNANVDTNVDADAGKTEDNLDNFEIGEPDECESGRQRRPDDEIGAIEQESEDVSQDLNSDKHIDSSLIKSSRDGEQN